MNYTIDYTEFITPDVCLEIQKSVLDDSIIPIIHTIAMVISVLIVLFLVYIVIKGVKKK